MWGWGWGREVEVYVAVPFLSWNDELSIHFCRKGQFRLPVFSHMGMPLVGVILTVIISGTGHFFPLLIKSWTNSLRFKYLWLRSMWWLRTVKMVMGLHQKGEIRTKNTKMFWVLKAACSILRMESSGQEYENNENVIYLINWLTFYSYFVPWNYLIFTAGSVFHYKYLLLYQIT